MERDPSGESLASADEGLASLLPPPSLPSPSADPLVDQQPSLKKGPVNQANTLPAHQQACYYCVITSIMVADLIISPIRQVKRWIWE